MLRFDRFTERAQDAAHRAYDILQRYGHTQVDSEHILLALLEQSEGLVQQILERLSVDIAGMRSRVTTYSAKARAQQRSTATAPTRFSSRRASRA